MSEDRRRPVAKIVFTGPTIIPGLSMMQTTLVAGERRIVDGKEWYPPAMWFDPVDRLIKIEDLVYPMERVHCLSFLKAALTKSPPPLVMPDYTVGKRAPKTKQD